jgi:uncharacterized protein
VIAGRTSSDLVALRCRAPAAVAAERLAGQVGSAADADEATAAAMAADEEPWPQAHDLSTDRAEQETLAAAAHLVARERAVLTPPAGSAGCRPPADMQR